jgi:hypothetical protein
MHIKKQSHSGMFWPQGWRVTYFLALKTVICYTDVRMFGGGYDADERPSDLFPVVYRFANDSVLGVYG